MVNSLAYQMLNSACLLCNYLNVHAKLEKLMSSQDKFGIQICLLKVKSSTVTLQPCVALDDINKQSMSLSFSLL